MKWRRIIILWTVLFVPLSFYNIFANPIFFPTQPIQYNDTKVQHYNFSMTSTIYVTGNFSASFPLSRSPTYYQLSARVHASVDYESYGAYGAFRMLVSVAENGVHHSPNNAEMDFVLPPPVPPSGYGLAANGPLPGTTDKEVFSHLVEGTNTIQLNYTFWSAGIDTQPPKYGPGYFKLDVGPFSVNVIDLVTVYSLGVLSEFIIAVLVFPVA